MEARVAEFLVQCDGDWAVYVEELDTGRTVVIGSERMRAASLIKLYILACFLEQNPSPAETELALLREMITVSSNSATNELVLLLGDGSYDAGMAAVNGWAEENGFSDTSQGRDLQDWRAEPPPGENYTSAADCGRFLSQLYRQELVRPETDTMMLELLLAQTRTWKIPAGLPADAVCANKTGELETSQHDCAIVYAPFGDFILCVLSDNLSDSAAAQTEIPELAALVYGYFADTGE